MRRDLWDCGCKPCCSRELFSYATATPRSWVTEPFDYWGERNHQINVEVSCAAKPPGDAASSPYWFQPVTVDTVLWCNANGGSAAGRLRLRVEHGTARSLGYPTGATGPVGVVAASDASDQLLATHTVSCRSDGGFGTNALVFGYPPSVPDVVELLIYLEFVRADGSVSQSVQVTRFPPVYAVGAMRADAYTFEKMIVRWDVSVVDDVIYASASVAKSLPSVHNPTFSDPANSLAFPHHVFQPEPLAGGIQNIRHGLQWQQPSTLTTVNARFFSKRKAVAKTPCIPSSVSPYCVGGQYASTPAAWPWKHAGDCTSWRRTGGIIGSPCSSQKTALQLTVPAADPVYGIGPQAFGMLIDGQYELTASRPAGGGEMANSLFWFSDSPGRSWTASGSATYTLNKIEISAALGLNEIGQQAIVAPCADGDWTAGVYFIISCVITTAAPNQPPKTTRVSHQFSGSGGLNFLNGSEVQFVPYGTNGIFGFKPQVGPWPFFFPTSAGVDELVGYGSASNGDTPPPFKIKLV